MRNNSDRLTTLTAQADRNGGPLTLEPEFLFLPMSVLPLSDMQKAMDLAIGKNEVVKVQIEP